MKGTSPLDNNDIPNQLEQVEAQLQIATIEKTKCLDLLSAEKAEKQALMPPIEERKPALSVFQRLRGVFR